MRSDKARAAVWVAVVLFAVAGLSGLAAAAAAGGYAEVQWADSSHAAHAPALAPAHDPAEPALPPTTAPAAFLAHPAAAGAASPATAPADHDGHHAAPAAADPLTRLREGNARYVSGALAHPGQDPHQRVKVAVGQKPFAVILGCADSRVPPEIVFDQGVGDLFVIRVAGNIVDESGLASIEYAVDHLGATLVVVLGHERCGAVHAAVLGGEAHGHLPVLLKALQPAVEAARATGGDPVEAAVVANVHNMVGKLRTAPPILADLVAAGKVRIVGARYDLDTGEVTWLP